VLGKEARGEVALVASEQHGRAAEGAGRRVHSVVRVAARDALHVMTVGRRVDPSRSEEAADGLGY
jgi:hypothetical protein